MSRFHTVFLGVVLGACGSCGASPPAGGDPARPEPAHDVPLSYEVHEWGLVRGTMLDQVMLSGPHRDEIPVPVAKPLLYFHRDGAGPLSVDVEVAIANGRIVEHWPLAALGEGAARLAWRGVEVVEGHCAGSRYPTEAEAPCDAIRPPDACEAATLSTVESTDGDCVRFGGAAFDHLFYRGEIAGAPAWPLAVVRSGTSLRATATGTSAIPGRIVRIRRSTRRVAIVAAPAPGAAVTIPEPSASPAEGAAALAASLREAGLTEPEVLAFRRAWDETLFGGAIASAETPPAARPVAAATITPVGGLMMPSSDDAILYVLPRASADALAPLTFTPAPRAVHRAIVAWIDADAGRPARP